MIDSLKICVDEKRVEVPVERVVERVVEVPAAQDEAKLKVIGFIHEPVVAAIAYFNAPAAEDKKTILSNSTAARSTRF